MDLDEALEAPDLGFMTGDDEDVSKNAVTSSGKSAPEKDNEYYQYDPLPSERHIRVLTLKQVPFLDDPIECDIEMVPLGPDADYSPLSYSWAMEHGDATPNREIVIRGKRMKVTQNLFEGLRRIRSHANEDIRMWIDAVCINQADLDERSCQVAAMADVYKNGRKTLIWLGEGQPDEDENAYRLFRHLRGATEVAISGNLSLPCFQALSHEGVDESCTFGFNEPCRSCNGPVTGSFPSKFSDLEEQRQIINSLDSSVRELVGQKLVMALNFFTRRYWSRRWVVQELRSSLAREMLWGPFRMDGEEFWLIPALFYWACDYGVQWTAESQVAMDKMRVVLDGMYLALWSGERHKRQSLVELLRCCRYLQCSDPRDTIYSLISLDQRLCFRPDYSLEKAKVFVRCAQALIKYGYWKWVFLSCDRRARDTALPSWVPAFQGEDLAFASRGHAPDAPLRIEFNADRSITLSVYYVATIKTPMSDTVKRYETVYRSAVENGKGARRKSSGDPRTTYEIGYEMGDMQPGDMICALRKRVRYRYHERDVLVGLRRVLDCAGTYRIVFAIDTRWNFVRVQGAPRRTRFPDSDRMTVRII